jgi:hypothetical protein
MLELVEILRGWNLAAQTNAKALALRVAGLSLSKAESNLDATSLEAALLAIPKTL